MTDLLSADTPVRGELLPLIKQQFCDGQSAKFTLFIQPSLLWFNGHFPNTPILPGVVQLNWVRQLSVQLWPEHASWLNNMHQLEVVKFQQVIRPQDEVQLSIELQVERKRVQFNYRLGQKSVASGRLVSFL